MKKESLVDACERIRKEAEEMVRNNYAYDAMNYAAYRASKESCGFRGVDHTIDIEYTEVKDEDQKFLS